MDIIETIKKAEGFRAKPYRDHLGNLTIGYGWNLDAGLSEELASGILSLMLEIAAKDVYDLMLENNVAFGIGTPRTQVLFEMCYQLGHDRLSKFKKMWKALADRDYKQAAHEILWNDDENRRSHLWDQCTKRAERYARQMETGEYQEVD